jgi:NAD(P)-dependent dehydrogenase (short-subunit alcohol dehydrogenase family)
VTAPPAPQSLTFADKTVVLTGVSRRGQVGETVARAFAELGASVILLDRTGVEAEARAGEMRSDGLRATALGCDLTDADALARVAATVGERNPGGIDALVNVAGGFAVTGPVADTDPAVWQRMFAINLTTAYLTTRAFLALLRPRGGAIVYFASIAALPNGRTAGTAAYAAAKSGVLTLTRAVAEEERSTGVRANAIAPNSIRTGDNMAAMGTEAHYVERETVADVVTFLCSPASRGVTGQVIRLG